MKASEEFQSGLFGLRHQRVPFRIEPETAEQYIRSFDQDQFTVHRFSGAPDLAVWELVALHHWFDPSRMTFQGGGKTDLMFLSKLSAAWDAEENRLPEFLFTLHQVQLHICAHAGVLPLTSRESDEHWMWRMSVFDFLEVMLDSRLRGAPEPPAANVSEQTHLDLSELPPLIRLAVYAWREVSRPAALGGSYVFGDRNTFPSNAERRACVKRLAAALKLNAPEYSTSVSDTIVKMTWPPEFPRGGARPSRNK